MKNNNNNKKSKAERRAQSQRDKANAKAAMGAKPPKAKGARKQRAGALRQASAAAAYATGQQSGQPQVFRNSVDSCRIVHRELIASVVGTVAFGVQQSFPLNPGMPTFAPWLANEAAGWERYRFNKLRYCYYTRTGSNVPGSVMLAPDYDPADAAPVGEQIASSYQDTEEDAPWKDICCELPVKELMGDMKEKTIRNGALAANQDIKTYDAGNLHLCTVDGTAVAWGKLWVEYDVTLFTPQVPAGGFAAGGTLQGAGGSLAAATPFGAAPLPLGQLVLSAAGQVITVGNVQIGQEFCLAAGSTGTVISGYSLGATSGCTQVTNVFTGFPAAATTAGSMITFTCTALNPTVTLTVTATTITATRLIASVLAPVPAF
jgi:hypothetical protein